MGDWDDTASVHDYRSPHIIAAIWATGQVKRLAPVQANENRVSALERGARLYLQQMALVEAAQAESNMGISPRMRVLMWDEMDAAIQVIVVDSGQDPPRGAVEANIDIQY